MPQHTRQQRRVQLKTITVPELRASVLNIIRTLEAPGPQCPTSSLLVFSSLSRSCCFHLYINFAHLWTWHKQNRIVCSLPCLFLLPKITSMKFILVESHHFSLYSCIVFHQINAPWFISLVVIWCTFGCLSDILGIFLWVPDAYISVRHLSQGGIAWSQNVFVLHQTPPSNFTQQSYQLAPSAAEDWSSCPHLMLSFLQPIWGCVVVSHCGSKFAFPQRAMTLSTLRWVIGHLDFLLGEGPLLAVRHF